MKFNGETLSGSMQKKSSSPFPSQVLRNENFTPVECNLVPQVRATPGGPEAPPENMGFTAKGHDGATALALPGQSQNTGDDMEFPFEDILCLAELPIFTDGLNVLISPGDNGTSTVRVPIQSCDTNLQGAMCSRMIDSSSMHKGNEIVLSSEPSSYAPMSGFQSSSRLPLLEENNVIELFLSTYSDDISKDSRAGDQHCDDKFLKTPLSEGGSVRATSKGVIGWLKIKAVMQWGIFVRKIVTTRRVRIVQLDEQPLKSRLDLIRS